MKPSSRDKSAPREKTASREPSREDAAAAQKKLSQHLARNAIVDLSVDSKEALLRKLAEVVVENASDAVIEKIYHGIEEREAAVTTYVGNGVAIPHARVDVVDGISVALARSPAGFPYGIETDEPVVLVILVVGHESLRDEHVRVLGLIANLFKDREMRDRVLQAPDAAAIRRLLDQRPGEGGRRRTRRRSQLLLSHARSIAKEVGATAVLVNIEGQEELKILGQVHKREMFVVVTSSQRLAELAERVVQRVLRLPHFPVQQDARVRLTALMALAHGLIRRGDVVAFLSGREGGELDTMTILEIGREFGRFLRTSGEVSKGVRAEVLQSVISLAAELGLEGREGSPVGTIFVLAGEPEKLGEFTQQMVINPFRGYPEEERNILDPTLAETIKEFASIDGAFIIGGDGTVLSAGTYLKVAEEVELPGGYGTRHRAACAITKAVDCVAVTLSQSTAEVTVFKQGSALVRLPRQGTR